MDAVFRDFVLIQVQIGFHRLRSFFGTQAAQELVEKAMF